MNLFKVQQLNRWVLLIVIGVGFALQFVIDAAIQGNLLGHRELSALLDPVAHVVLAVIVVLPWILAKRLPWFHLLLAATIVVLIDIDHFVAAGSLSVKDAISLPMRPPSHSLLFCTALAMILGWITRRSSVAAIVFLALLTHISRDATSGGTPWLWPFSSSPRLPAELHLCLWLAVTGAGLLLASRSKR